MNLAGRLRRGQRLEAENLTLRDSAADDGRKAAQHHRRVAGDEVGFETGRANRTGGCQHSDYRRERAGKGVIARALHATSARSAKPLVSLNAGALAEGVFESELFGHVRGAFTDAKADRVGRFELG